PFREAEFDIMYNEGISREGSLLDLGIEIGVIDKKGAWLYFEGAQVGQGRDAAKEELKRNKELYAKIEKAALAKLKGGEAPESIGVNAAP
ncbi:MAG TPA: DNA recombination/repair protein RecA, partial [Candidatus Methylacidiphilales bacterium]|nr:DNA recombination/repair protein RecA [Candidatus Methylacidiphilales bacterium]